MTAVSQLSCWQPYHCNFKQISLDRLGTVSPQQENDLRHCVLSLHFLPATALFCSLSYSAILCSLQVIYNSCLVCHTGGRVKTWKRRWFILTDNCLYYFEYTTVSNCRLSSLAGWGNISSFHFKWGREEGEKQSKTNRQ